MQLDQLHRQLKSDPDNVELARQLWNALLREQITAELADIDVTDPSPKNWKAILRLVVTSDSQLRPLLVAVLALLLQDWPTGSRPLLTGLHDFTYGWFNQRSLTESGAWLLVDKVDFGATDYSYVNFLRAGHAHIKILGPIYPIHSYQLPFSSDRQRLAHTGAFPQLEKLELDTNTSLHDFLNGDSNESAATRKALRSLTICYTTNRAEDDRLSLFRHDNLRASLFDLRIVAQSYLPDIFKYSWPSLRSLVIDFIAEDFEEAVDLRGLKRLFPCLSTVRINFTSRYSLLSERIARKLHFVGQVCSSLGVISNCELALFLNDAQFKSRAYKTFEEKYLEHVTRWHLSFQRSSFTPEPTKPPSLVELSESTIANVRKSSDFFSRFLSVFSQTKALILNSPKHSLEVLSDTKFLRFTELRRLKLNLHCQSAADFNKIMTNLSRLNLTELTLDLSCGSVQRAPTQVITLPKSLKSLHLRVDATTVDLVEQIANLPALAALEIYNHNLTAAEILAILNHQNCSELKLLQIAEPLDVDDGSFRQLNDFAFWKSIRLDQLEHLYCRILTDPCKAQLLDHFPAITSFGASEIVNQNEY